MNTLQSLSDIGFPYIPVDIERYATVIMHWVGIKRMTPIADPIDPLRLCALGLHLGDDVLEEGLVSDNNQGSFWFIEGITNAIPLKVLALVSVRVHQRFLRPVRDNTEMDEVKIIQWDRSGDICIYSIKFFIDVLIRFKKNKTDLGTAKTKKQKKEVLVKEKTKLRFCINSR